MHEKNDDDVTETSDNKHDMLADTSGLWRLEEPEKDEWRMRMPCTCHKIKHPHSYKRRICTICTLIYVTFTSCFLLQLLNFEI